MWGPRSAKLPSKMQAPHLPVSEMGGGQVSRGSLPQAVLTKKPFQTNLGTLISDREWAGGYPG